MATFGDFLKPAQTSREIEIAEEDVALFKHRHANSASRLSDVGREPI